MRARAILPWAVLAVLLVASLGVLVFGGSSESTASEREREVASQLKCLVCSGETVADSNSGFAVALREQIREGIDEGQTNDEILAELAADPALGERILLEPPADGIGAVVWVVPVVALVLGAVGLAFAFVRWRREPLQTATDDDEVIVARARREADDTPEPGAVPEDPR